MTAIGSDRRDSAMAGPNALASFATWGFDRSDSTGVKHGLIVLW